MPLQQIVTLLHSGRGLFVRLTTTGNPAGWGEGSMTNTYLQFNGSINEYTKNTATNPYIQTAEHGIRYYATSVAYYEYNPFEFAYIPL